MKLLFLFLLCFLCSCTKHGVDAKDQVIARINGQPIYAREFLATFEQLKSEQNDIAQKNPKLMDQLKTRALNETIINGILRSEAEKRSVRVPKEEVESRLSSWKDGYPPGGFEEMLKKQNTSEEFLKKKIEDQLLVENLVASAFAEETLVSDEESNKYFEKHSKEFVRPEKVHAFQIVVPTIEEAQKIRQEIISKKTTFESAARSFSLSPDAAKGGDLGFFARDEKIAAFNEAFSVPVGSLSNPIQSRFGVHILKVVEKEPSKKLSQHEAKPEIIKLLKKEKEMRVYREWVTKLLKDGEIYRNEALYAQFM